MAKTNRSIVDKVRFYAGLSLQRQREGHITALRQAAEMFAIFALTGNGPGFYHMAGFWRRDIPWQDKRGHLGASGYQKRLGKLNPLDYRKITQNKLSEKSMLQLLGFPTPRFLGYLHPVHGRTHTGAPLRNSGDLSGLLSSEQLDRVCFKLIEGWAGRKFEVVDIIRHGNEVKLRRPGDQSTVEIADFYRTRLDVEKTGGMLIEAYLYQHPDLAAFNPSSVNTLRIWVVQCRDGQMRTILAYLRIGRAGSIVDNQSSGGIVAPIHLDTGVTGCAMDGLPTRELFPSHPDHGAPIEGRELPFWNEARSLAERCLAAFPNLGFAGMDIAVTENGPVVVEMNASPDREGAAFTGTPTKQIFCR